MITREILATGQPLNFTGHLVSVTTSRDLPSELAVVPLKYHPDGNQGASNSSCVASQLLDTFGDFPPARSMTETYEEGFADDIFRGMGLRTGRGTTLAMCQRRHADCYADMPTSRHVVETPVGDVRLGVVLAGLPEIASPRRASMRKAKDAGRLNGEAISSSPSLTVHESPSTPQENHT